jgi:hypothetical protein
MQLSLQFPLCLSSYANSPSSSSPASTTDEEEKEGEQAQEARMASFEEAEGTISPRTSYARNSSADSVNPSLPEHRHVFCCRVAPRPSPCSSCSDETEQNSCCCSRARTWPSAGKAKKKKTKTKTKKKKKKPEIRL